MKPETLDPVIELRDAISQMLAADDRMALLDEEGRIAAINPAWREAARRESHSAAAVGRGARFLDQCDRAAAEGERDAAELAVAIRRVLARETTCARVDLESLGRRGSTVHASAWVRRVRGPLENWLLLAYSDAQGDKCAPTWLPELGIALGARPTRGEVVAVMDSVASHVAILDDSGRIVAVNAAWRRFAEQCGASAAATGPGADYLAVCAAALRSGDRRGAQFAEGLGAVLEGRRRSWWSDSRVDLGGELRTFRGRITHVETAEGPLLVVAHTDLSASAERATAA